MSYDIELNCNGLTREEISALKLEIDPLDELTYLYDVKIVAKNPTSETIAKLYAAGIKYGIIPIGDDGESYNIFGHQIGEKVGFLGGINNFFSRTTSYHKGPKLENGYGYCINDNVVDLWGNKAVVVAIYDLNSIGIGYIECKYEDGRISAMTSIGHPMFKKCD